MHDSRESSYYEIALTNRQVVVFFVVLLICVVGAFFSGVWLGQRRADEAPQITARAEAAEESAEDAETLQELNFFTEDPGSRPRRSAAAKQPPAEPEPESERPILEPVGDPETTLLEDLQGAAPEAVAESEPEATPEPPAESSAAEEATSEPTEVAESPAPRPTAPSRSPAADLEGYVIQVFSSPDGAQARKLLDRLVEGGYEAFLSPVVVDGRTMYRVRIGPLATRREADSMAAEVGKAYQVDTWVTRNE